MFSGIIEEVARVSEIDRFRSPGRIKVKSDSLFSDTEISDSVAVNGVCLTAADKKNNFLIFEVAPATFSDTNLKRLKKNDFLNLEGALKVNDKIGGHFVLGHVDRELKVKKIIKRSGCWKFELDLPPAFRKFVVEKGSIALEGISLTVKNVFSGSFTVEVIPHTFKNTNLKYKKAGQFLNAEFDYLLKNRG